MSDRVERKILAMLPDHALSPYGNPIPGLERARGPRRAHRLPARACRPSTRWRRPSRRRSSCRRIGEPVQVDSEALGLLTTAGPDAGPAGPGAPGRRARVIACRDGAEEASGVSLPSDIASHVFVQVT